ncbi:MAG TPA: hypothetical protein DDY49_10435 [Paenibacillaceae bacterium]|nr:hypothetical protein [Paenibacillaceae bacterium]
MLVKGMQFMNWKKGFIVLFLLLFTMGLTACTGENGDQTAKDGIQIEFNHPNQVSSGKMTEYSVKITKDNQPIENAEVVVSLEMVQMDHGKNGFLGKMTEPGVYKGEAALPMNGEWYAYVRVKAGEVETTKSFTFEADGHMLNTDELEKIGLDKSGAKIDPNF